MGVLGHDWEQLSNTEKRGVNVEAVGKKIRETLALLPDFKI